MNISSIKVSANGEVTVQAWRDTGAEKPAVVVVRNCVRPTTALAEAMNAVATLAAPSCGIAEDRAGECAFASLAIRADRKSDGDLVDIGVRVPSDTGKASESKARRLRTVPIRDAEGNPLVPAMGEDLADAVAALESAALAHVAASLAALAATAGGAE